MKNYLKSLYLNRGLIFRMTYKEMTDRYAGSNLGVFWAILQPLFLIVLYTVVFTFIFKVKISIESSSKDYALFAIAGLIPWLAFSEGINKSITSIYSKASLVKQSIFPIEILPLSSILPSFISLIIGLIIYFIILSIFMPDRFSLMMLLLPLVIIFNILFTLGLSYLLSLAGVYFRDLGELMTVILTVLTFATPILYIESMLPQKIIFLMNFNLASHLIYIYKDIIYTGKINHPYSFLIFGLFSLIFFSLGIRAFHKSKHLLANIL
ncbi:MAG: ABC transporter permease [Patescibacteria group bacterium]